MGKRLYVGGLSYNTTEEEVIELFNTIGETQSVKLIIDRETGRSKGFAFVEMMTDEDSEKAITSFNDYEFGGRKLTVNEARPMEDRKPGFSGGGSRSGGFNDRGGNGGGGRY